MNFTPPPHCRRTDESEVVWETAENGRKKERGEGDRESEGERKLERERRDFVKLVSYVRIKHNYGLNEQMITEGTTYIDY